ncbi:flagellar export protein FliJ [Caldimonas sp. KR1-144]|uniref:flagellar export protein FliJ n=1 Tax=Caldimonas sp. KR1-144 TaxID=3400911 RepID=UPI003C08F98F
MNAATDALSVLIDKVSSERDDAQLELQRAQGALAAARQQLEQLGAYGRDYAQRYAGARSSSVELLRCYHGFMDRLDQAQAMQRRACEQAELRVERTRAELLALELRVASVKKLIERRDADHARAAERREQKLTDEQASRAAWQRLAAGGALAA